MPWAWVSIFFKKRAVHSKNIILPEPFASLTCCRTNFFIVLIHWWWVSFQSLRRLRRMKVSIFLSTKHSQKARKAVGIYWILILLWDLIWKSLTRIHLLLLSAHRKQTVRPGPNSQIILSSLSIKVAWAGRPETDSLTNRQANDMATTVGHTR